MTYFPNRKRKQIFTTISALGYQGVRAAFNWEQEELNCEILSILGVTNLVAYSNHRINVDKSTTEPVHTSARAVYHQGPNPPSPKYHRISARCWIMRIPPAQNAVDLDIRLCDLVNSYMNEQHGDMEGSTAYGHLHARADRWNMYLPHHLILDYELVVPKRHDIIRWL